MIKIAIPANMPTAITHLQAAGRNVKFANGGDLGWVEGANSRNFIVRLRSFDIPIVVDDSCDVGLCGSDVYEERKKVFDFGLEILDRFSYGRVFGTSPRLELVVTKENSIKNPKEIKPGTIILTEHPHLTKEFLEDNGVKVSILGENSAATTLPGEFRNWCTREGRVGVQVVHGRIPALVRLGAGLGVMVNETGATILANELKVVAKLQDIEMLLVADRKALKDGQKGVEIKKLAKDLEQAYFTISLEYETSIINHEREL